MFFDLKGHEVEVAHLILLVFTGCFIWALCNSHLEETLTRIAGMILCCFLIILSITEVFIGLLPGALTFLILSCISIREVLVK